MLIIGDPPTPLGPIEMPVTPTRPVLGPPLHARYMANAPMINQIFWPQAKYVAAPHVMISTEDQGSFTEQWEYTQSTPLTTPSYTEVWNTF